MSLIEQVLQNAFLNLISALPLALVLAPLLAPARALCLLAAAEPRVEALLLFDAPRRRHRRRRRAITPRVVIEPTRSKEIGDGGLRRGDALLLLLLLLLEPRRRRGAFSAALAGTPRRRISVGGVAPRGRGRPRHALRPLGLTRRVCLARTRRAGGLGGRSALLLQLPRRLRADEHLTHLGRIAVVVTVTVVSVRESMLFLLVLLLLLLGRNCGYRCCL